MLAELHISGLGVIEDAVIEPAPGLTVVTGETGAGKTMIVTAVGLVSGARGDAQRVRTGAAKAVVEARFAPVPGDDPHFDYLRDAAESVDGELDDDGSLLLARSIAADGRSRAHVAGRSTPVGTLATVAESLVAVHGQSEAMRLLQPAQQRHVIDVYGDLADDRQTYARARADYRAARAELEQRQGASRELAQREALLRLGLEEIEQIDPQPAEDVTIAVQIRRLVEADSLRVAATQALTALTGPRDDPAAVDAAAAADLAGSAARILADAGDPELAARVSDLHQAAAVLTDVAADIAGYLDDLDADPERLQELLQRQSLLRGLTRKYGPDIDAVLSWSANAAEELASLDTSDAAIEQLQRRVIELEAAMARAADTLTAGRKRAGEKLAAKATAELEHLAMPHAAVRVSVTPLPEPGSDGADQVDILLTARPGAPELPVAKSASGGELSRIMLALEVVLAGADPVGTLIFDEVDAGVGGRAATEIGQRLARLAQRHQVIVVTHLAQVAAFADRHYVVDADESGSVGASAVRQAAGDDRIRELARMLGGTDGDSALAHAVELRAAATSNV